MADTLATADGPGAALRALIGAYAGFAAGHPALIDLMISEIRSLPEGDREAALTAQRDYHKVDCTVAKDSYRGAGVTAEAYGS